MGTKPFAAWCKERAKGSPDQNAGEHAPVKAAERGRWREAVEQRKLRDSRQVVMVCKAARVRVASVKAFTLVRWEAPHDGRLKAAARENEEGGEWRMLATAYGSRESSSGVGEQVEQHAPEWGPRSGCRARRR